MISKSLQIKVEKKARCVSLLKDKRVNLYYEYMFSCVRENGKLVHYHHKYLSDGKMLRINLTTEMFKLLRPIAEKQGLYIETSHKKTVDRYNNRTRI